MNEIFHNLFIGSEEQYLSIEKWETDFVLHACKEPYHRQFVGYTGRACDKDHPEYLRAVRGKEIALNLVDAKESKYFDYNLIFDAVKDVLTILRSNGKVYIHCNQGESRAPSIGLLVLLALHVLDADYETAQRQYLSIYPNYNPGQGIKDFVKENWEKFVEASKPFEYKETTPEEEGYVKIDKNVFTMKK